MDTSNHPNMDDATMIRYLLGKYGMTDLVAKLRSAAASGKRFFSFPFPSTRSRASIVPTDTLTLVARARRRPSSGHLGKQ